MKTKIKLIYILFLGLTILPSVNAAWYTTGIQGTAPNIAGTNTNCVQDLYPDTTPPTVGQGTGPAGTFGFAYHNGQVQVLATGQCQWWDGTPPVITKFTFPTGYTTDLSDTAISGSLTATDTGGAGFHGYYGWYRYQDNPNATTPGPWSSWIIYKTGWISANFYFHDTTRPSTMERKYEFMVSPVDKVLNFGDSKIGGPITISLTPPKVSATNTGIVWKNKNIPYTLNVSDNGGAPLNAAKSKYRWDNADCVSGGAVYADGDTGILSLEGDHVLYLCAENVAGRTATWSGQYRLDKTLPVAMGLTYANTATDGWTNNTNIVLSWTTMNDPLAGSPLGASGLKDYDIIVYSITNAQGTPVAPSVLTIVGATAAPYTFVGVDGYAYKFEICPRDIAGNVCSGVTTSTEIARIDTTSPIPSDLINNTLPTNLLATSPQTFNFTFNDGGAPVQLTSQIEDVNNPAGWIPASIAALYTYTPTSNEDIHLVDLGGDRITDGGTAREYIYRTTHICDWAGNCWNGTKDFNYNVYANPNYVPVNTQDTSAFGGAVADGVPHNFVHTIQDGYGNAIIPASGISRTISMNLSSITNTMFLDQHSRIGSTSVYVTAPSSPVVSDEPLSFAPTQAFTNPMISSNGSYPLTMKVYTPTANSYATGDPVSDSAAEFGFTTNLVVNDTIIGLAANKTFPQTYSAPTAPPQPSEHFFSPLYTTAITGNLRDGGFIEGTEQQSLITIKNNNTLISPISPELQLEFNGSNNGFFDFFGGSITSSATPITTARSIMVNNPSFTGSATTNTDLYTTLLQKSSTKVADLSDLLLSTHFSYTLDSHAIVYNSDIIGKSSYHDASAAVNVGTQVGIKIIGPIASSLMYALTTNQFTSNASIFSGISRTTVNNNMRKSIALATRNMISTTVSDTITNASLLDAGVGAIGSKVDKGSDGSLMKLEKNGGTVTLGLTTGIIGKRSLVIKGADLYINKNMYYNPGNPDSILGVVVQKNEAGQGGNLYIHPSVTNVVGTYIIDGSIMSSMNGTSSMGTSNIGLLKNQLYIYGSIVSENTLGGSRMSPPRCPSLVATCADAQQYDLNYLRRYYLYNGAPFGGNSTRVAGSGACDSSTCSGFDPNLIKKFTTPTDDLAKYPVIIEYNPRMRTNPPIGFDQMTD